MEKESNVTQVREIRVFVGSATNKNTGEKFPTFKTVGKDGRFIRVKFRKEVTNVPASDCNVFVKDDQISVDGNRQYPVIWIHQIEKTEAIYQPNKQLEKTRGKLDNLI